MGWFSKPDPTAAAAAAVSALQKDMALVRDEYTQVGESFQDALDSDGTLLMLFGFVDYHCSLHKIRGAKERVAVAADVYRRLFGDTQGIRMFGGLDRAFRERATANERPWTSNIDWVKEGFNAARESFGGKLVADFLRGRLQAGTDPLIRQFRSQNS